VYLSAALTLPGYTASSFDSAAHYCFTQGMAINLAVAPTDILITGLSNGMTHDPHLDAEDARDDGGLRRRRLQQLDGVAGTSDDVAVGAVIHFSVRTNHVAAVQLQDEMSSGIMDETITMDLKAAGLALTGHVLPAMTLSEPTSSIPNMTVGQALPQFVMYDVPLCTHCTDDAFKLDHRSAWWLTICGAAAAVLLLICFFCVKRRCCGKGSHPVAPHHSGDEEGDPDAEGALETFHFKHQPRRCCAIQ